MRPPTGDSAYVCLIEDRLQRVFVSIAAIDRLDVLVEARDYDVWTIHDILVVRGYFDTTNLPIVKRPAV